MENSDAASHNFTFLGGFQSTVYGGKDCSFQHRPGRLDFLSEPVDDTIKLCDDAELRFSSVVYWAISLLFHLPHNEVSRVFKRKMNKNAPYSEKKNANCDTVFLLG